MIFIIGFSLLAALLHVLFFVMESILFRKKRIHALFGVTSGNLPVTAPVFFNLGFYNLFLGLGGFSGLFTYIKGGSPALLVHVLAFMAGAAVVLLISRKAMYRGALLQGVPPVVALILLALR